MKQHLSNCLRGGIDLLCQDLLLLAEVVHGLCSQLHLRPKLLLSTPQICHPSEDEVEALHDLLPTFIIVTRSPVHGVQDELGLRRGFGGRRGVDPSEKGITGSDSTADRR